MYNSSNRLTDIVRSVGVVGLLKAIGLEVVHEDPHEEVEVDQAPEGLDEDDDDASDPRWDDEAAAFQRKQAHGAAVAWTVRAMLA